ncbi:hypothetical protein [Methylibium sp.]|uniref:hypothetical protein n=1 Tax=Methylibium sp. TaxID=2067992 RepID=UPI00286D050F|nr:hypothetical protein [Methylibium sp.]
MNCSPGMATVRLPPVSSARTRMSTLSPAMASKRSLPMAVRCRSSSGIEGRAAQGFDTSARTVVGAGLLNIVANQVDECHARPKQMRTDERQHRFDTALKPQVRKRRIAVAAAPKMAP